VCGTPRVGCDRRRMGFIHRGRLDASLVPHIVDQAAYIRELINRWGIRSPVVLDDASWSQTGHELGSLADLLGAHLPYGVVPAQKGSRCTGGSS